MMDASETLNFALEMFSGVEAVDSALVSLVMVRAAVADAAGTAPLNPAWMPTYDEWLAAAEVAEMLHLRGAMSPADALKQATSEGATFVFKGTATDWRAVAAHLRSRSPLTAATPGWAMIPIPTDSPEFVPRSEVW